MAKKYTKLNKNQESKELKNNKPNNNLRPKKFELKVTSKMKKKLKLTKNKLNIEKLKIRKVISHIIKEEPPILKDLNEEQESEELEEDIKGEGGVPLYLYISLKKDLKDEEIKIVF